MPGITNQISSGHTSHFAETSEKTHNPEEPLEKDISCPRMMVTCELHQKKLKNKTGHNHGNASVD